MAGLRYLEGVTSLALDGEACTGCGRCVEVCPHGVFAGGEGTVEVADEGACIECGACARNCAVSAVTVRAGVGCAQYFINALLGRRGDSCCCGPDCC